MTTDPYSERELEILRLIACGASNDEIASRLFLSTGTVKWYNTQIYAKLGVKSRTQAIQRADQLGLLTNLDEPYAEIEDDAVTVSLPALPTPTTGRETELADIAELLRSPETRLLTLIGPGGIGKTQLAIEAAGRARSIFPDGVYFISLEALASPDDIASTIAATIDVRPCDFTNSSPTEAMIDALRDKRLLLATDNWDSLTAGASVVKEILSRAPNVKILVTTRERLNLQEETLYRVGGLKVPGTGSYDDLIKNGAVALFLFHTRRIRPDYRPGVEDLQAIATICRLVEGMPLGIVLAAAWMEMLTPIEIAREISASLDFLAFYSRDLPERHQSVRAVFASTWRRLSEEEQRLFVRVSVFRGGFTRTAAEAVGAATLRELMLLANKSLITRDDAGRYNTHPLLRQYAAEQLELTTAANETFSTHSRYYLGLLATCSGAGLDDPAVTAQIAEDFENIRAACVWAVDHAVFSAFDGALDTLYAFCMRRSRYVDMISLLERILEGAQKNDRENFELIQRARDYRSRTLNLMGEVDDLHWVGTVGL